MSLESINSTDEAASLFRKWFEDKKDDMKPECVFVDLNMIGSSFDGIELTKKINLEYGNGVVIGIISSSIDDAEVERAKNAGAQFWMVKSDDIEPRLLEFKEDYKGYQGRRLPFKIYK